MDKFKIITMTDGNYFKYGMPFLKTAAGINADIVCYAPEESLSINQKYDLFYIHNVELKCVPENVWKTKMQWLKFRFLSNEMTRYGGANKEYTGLTFCDFDTFFIRDWFPSIQWDSFDIGITIRQNEIEKGNSWALSNGGVIIMPNTERAQTLCKRALDVMLRGYDDELPQYNELFTSLESKQRPEHKRCYRTDLHWNVDQVFLSALIKYCLDNKTDKWKLWKIKMFNCDQMNRLDSIYGNEYDAFICHMKKTGRERVN